MDYYVGEIRAFAGFYAPANWAFCNGSLLPINQNQALYSLIGTTYGGDGVNNFALPNLCGRIPVNVGQGLGLSNYKLGQTAGAENVVLATGNLPVHNHSVNASSNSATVNTPSGNYLAAPSSQPASKLVMYLPDSATGRTVVALDTNSVSNTGAGQPHTNLMPYVTISYIIAVIGGIYPSPS